MTVFLRDPIVADSPSEHHVERNAVPSRSRRSGGFYFKVGKPVLDFTLVVLSLPVVLPLIALLALLVARDGAAPFYWQKRVGRNGRAFNMLKLRSMVPGAEDILEDYLRTNPEARREWDLTQKLQDDPRITRLGRFLRQSSLDELPQLWNVLRGEMALVGPRPMMVDQQILYPGTEYYEMRPGLTGLWQVSDRNDTSFAERAYYDAEYYGSVSLSGDMSIILRTVGVVFRGTGC